VVFYVRPFAAALSAASSQSGRFFVPSAASSLLCAVGIAFSLYYLLGVMMRALTTLFRLRRSVFALLAHAFY
jgi:hypothetical protein